MDRETHMEQVTRIGRGMRPLLRLALPAACVWAWRQEVVILRRGVALDAAQARTARSMGIAHPERIRLLRVEVVPPLSRLLRAIGGRLGIVSDATIGMTLRYGIFIQSEHRQDRRLLVHEMAHVAQYERLGGFRGFLSAYIAECIDPGYPHGPLECEARRAELGHC